MSWFFENVGLKLHMMMIVVEGNLSLHSNNYRQFYYKILRFSPQLSQLFKILSQR